MAGEIGNKGTTQRCKNVAELGGAKKKKFTLAKQITKTLSFYIDYLNPKAKGASEGSLLRRADIL